MSSVNCSQITDNISIIDNAINDNELCNSYSETQSNIRSKSGAEAITSNAFSNKKFKTHLPRHRIFNNNLPIKVAAFRDKKSDRGGSS